MSSIQLYFLIGLFCSLQSCGFKPATDFDQNQSSDDSDANDIAEDPLYCRLYGKETAFTACLVDADPREQTSLKALLRANDQMGTWSSLYFHTEQFEDRYDFSDSEIECLENVLCDQSANGS